MLMMVALLAMVTVGIQLAANPANWRWFFMLGGEGENASDVDLREIDFRVRDESEDLELKPGTFISSVRTVETGVETEQEAGAWQIPRPLLDEIEDQRVGILRKEQPAFDAMLDRLDDLTSEELRKASASDIGYRVVNVEPEQYRGRLVTLTGTARRSRVFRAGDDDTPKLFDTWLFTEDSGNNPWVVVSPELPPELPVGENLEVQVEVTGYFFKRYGYATAYGLHVAPMLIARTLQVAPKPITQQRTEDLTIYVVGLLGGLIALFGALAVAFWFSDRKFAKGRTAEIAARGVEADLDALEALKQAPLHDPSKVALSSESEDPNSAM